MASCYLHYLEKYKSYNKTETAIRKLLKRSFAGVSSDFKSDQPFRRQRSRKVKNVIFQQKRFSTIKSLYEKIEK